MECFFWHIWGNWKTIAEHQIVRERDNKPDIQTGKVLIQERQCTKCELKQQTVIKHNLTSN